MKSIQEKLVIYVASLYMHGMLSECVYLFGSGIDRSITHSSSVNAKNTEGMRVRPGSIFKSLRVLLKLVRVL